ncbi:MAG: response regulator [Candidatus Alcyoniella australis]|nr:response regulator [Candidatus Alcyoniella australis]
MVMPGDEQKIKHPDEFLSGSSESILVIDEESEVRESLVAILESEGYEVIEAVGGPEAVDLFASQPTSVVISAVKMKGIDGFEILSKVKSLDESVDVILVTAYPSVEVANRALELGAFDYIQKPFHYWDILLSVKRALEKRRINQRYFDLRRDFKKSIRNRTLAVHLRTQEKQQLLVNVIQSLVYSLEAKDKYTEGHSRRVAEDSLAVAQIIGLSEREQVEIHLAGLLHDIGKIGIKESILNKPSGLTREEYEVIKSHPLISQKIVEPISQFKRVSLIIRHHHELFDGSGYPDGLSMEDIPLGARILSICDAFDAMTSDRPYRAALSTEQSLTILRRNAATQFDPQLVEPFIRTKGFGSG